LPYVHTFDYVGIIVVDVANPHPCHLTSARNCVRGFTTVMCTE